MMLLCDNYFMNKLFTGKMNFQPSLPAPKIEIMKRMPISLLNKVIITYDKVSFKSYLKSNLKPANLSFLKRLCSHAKFPYQTSLVFIRPSLRRDVLWYTTVRPSVSPSVRPFHMLRSNLRTPWPIHFKLHIVIGIDSLMVCILFGGI